MKDYLAGKEIETSIKIVKLCWWRVSSGVPQDSLLAQLISIININDILEGRNSYMNLFECGAKLL